MRIGIDIVEISRFKKMGKSDYSVWDHVFSETEWEYAFRDVHVYEHLAGMFALKEAVVKATGEINMRKINIHFTPSGAPEVQGLLVSISHTKDTAVAVALCP